MDLSDPQAGELFRQSRGKAVSKQRMTRNAGKCAKCGDVIESTHRHDFRFCKCGAIFIDGGLDYQRFGWTDDGDFINMAEYEEVAR